MHSVRPGSVRQGISCAVCMLGIQFICLCIPRAQPQGQQAHGDESGSCIGRHMLLVTAQFVCLRSKLKRWSLEQRKKTPSQKVGDVGLSQVHLTSWLRCKIWGE